MAHNTISRHVMRRLLIAAMIGATAAAGVTQLASSTSTTAPSTASSTGEDRARPEHTPPTPRSSSADSGSVVVGAAGSSVSTRTSARAEGIAITGASRLTARPTVLTTSGTRLATEPTVLSSGDLVTATGVTLAAAVTNGHSSAHALVRTARYGRHDLGPLAVHCRDGVPEAERVEIVQLTRNIQVRYGQASGNRITGASVLVLGTGDRVIRVVTVATVTCTASSAATPTSRPSTQPSGPDAPHPSRATETPAPIQPVTASAGPGALERRLMPHAPARPVLPVTTGL
jgi:hypothetical protein